ncbi:ATP-binding protein [Cellulomonas massiliensis]|uniref:ATP-binding protein n=1 Tax=Cellulomonas massiliensis TaxID=1465811 RepID=UPI00037AEE89|nr:ATP-binding protein [Cellulomonas massiliensis]
MGDVRHIASAASVRRRASRLVLDEERVVSAETSAPRAIRHWVMRAIAAAEIVGAPNQVVELLTGELVSNAVVHGPEGGSVRVRLTVDGYLVRVEVTDEGGGHPTVLHPEPTAPHGRGLALVEALATGWGTWADEAGTTVWFEVDADE